MRKILFIFLACLALTVQAKKMSNVWVSDQGNGTFVNPIIYADYSDPDVICVGDDYYMTASSFNCVPGLPILHSKDLVNWTLVNHALNDLIMEGVSPVDFYDKPQHGCGVWAPCIRYHEGEFFIYWGDPDFGIFVVKTRDILGTWDEPILVLEGKGRIDPTPLFDDDGRVYLAHAWASSRSKTKCHLVLCELNADGTKPISQQTLIYDGVPDGNFTTEGTKMMKRDGYYYVLAPAGGVATGWQMALRSESVYGPYEMKRVLAQGNTQVNGPHQGGLVNTPEDDWWFVHFQEVEACGRIVHLQPVKWEDGWPVMGVNAKNYCGEPLLEGKKPDVSGSHTRTTPQDSDEFSLPHMGLQWQWHANPKQNWGYATAMGYYRMYGQYYPKGYRNFWEVPNLLLQKFPAPNFNATLKADVVLRNEGDMSGLICMGRDYAYLALQKTAGGFVLKQVVCKDAELGTQEKTVTSIVEPRGLDAELFNINYATTSHSVCIYLRLQVLEGVKCQYYYSTNGKRFSPIGEPFDARQGKWIGAKMGMFIMNATANTERSWMDMDWFRVEAVR